MRAAVLFVALALSITCASGERHARKKSHLTKRFLLSSDQQTMIEQGFNVAKDLTSKIDKIDFGGVTGGMVGAVSKYLSALSPFVGVILSFFGSSGPSPEYQLLKQLFTDVENRFDQIDVQFSQLRQQVSFVATQVQFSDLEANINAVQTELDTLSKVTNTNGYNYEKHEYIKTFDRTYESSGIKLFNGIIHGGLTTGGIFHEYMSYSSDRKQTQQFMLGALNLLIRAVSLEMVYGQLNGDPNLSIKRHDWEHRFTQVRDKMKAIDAIFVRQYKQYLNKDVNDFGIAHPRGGLSNADFTDRLFSMLKTKYYWRNVLVIVSDVHNSDKFVAHSCDVNQHDNHGRTVVVASVDKTKHAVTYASLSGLHLYRSWVGHGDLQHHYACLSSNTGYNALPDSARNHCTTYAAAGVFCRKTTDTHVRQEGDRYHSYTPHGTNTAFLFG